MFKIGALQHGAGEEGTSLTLTASRYPIQCLDQKIGFKLLIISMKPGSTVDAHEKCPSDTRYTSARDKYAACEQEVDEAPVKSRTKQATVPVGRKGSFSCFRVRL